MVEHTHNDRFRVGLQVVVHFVVDLLDHRKIEQHRPQCHKWGESQREAKRYACDQFHMRLLFAFNKFVPKTIYCLQLDCGIGQIEFASKVLDLGVNEMEIIGLIGVVAPNRFG